MYLLIILLQISLLWLSAYSEEEKRGDDAALFDAAVPPNVFRNTGFAGNKAGKREVEFDAAIPPNVYRNTGFAGNKAGKRELS